MPQCPLQISDGYLDEHSVNGIIRVGKIGNRLQVFIKDGSIEGEEELLYEYIDWVGWRTFMKNAAVQFVKRSIN